MLTLTERAQERFAEALRDEDSATRLRVFIDHRCHCGKAHFSLTLENQPNGEDTCFDVEGIPFVAGPQMVPELAYVEIDFIETVWTKGFTIRNVDHDCGKHMMDRARA